MPPDIIPIEPAPPLSGNAPPLLRELAEMLRRLVDTGEAATLDLSALPLTPADLDWLREKLGQGEVAAQVQAEGESTFDETACPGVWWVTHRNTRGTVVAQFIEVTFVPELLKAPPQDVAAGCEHLEVLISEL
mgnify:CR=1 FL=1